MREFTGRYRFDLVYSYWIFTWYLLYIFKIIPYNPKLVLIIGVIENSLGLIFSYFYNLDFSWSKFWEWFAINFWIKIIPLYTVWNTKIHFRKDFAHFLRSLILYIIWCFIFGHKQFLKKMNFADAFKKGEKPKGDVTPMMLVIHDIREWIKNRKNG